MSIRSMYTIMNRIAWTTRSRARSVVRLLTLSLVVSVIGCDSREIDAVSGTPGSPLLYENIVISTISGGGHWDKPQTADASLFGITRLGDSVYVAVGYLNGKGRVFRSTNRGSTWRSDTLGSDTLFAVASSRDGTQNAVIVGGNGAAYRSADLGVTWDRVASGVSDALRSVAFSDGRIAMAVGDNGRMLWSENYGRTWSYVPNRTTKHLHDVVFSSSGGWVFVVGKDATVLRSKDYGFEWDTVAVPADDYFLSVAMEDTSNVMIVGWGAPFLQTHDGGESWVRQNAAVGYVMHSIERVDGVWYVVGTQGTFMKSHDGVAWSRTTVGTRRTVTSLHFIDEHFGLVVTAANE